MKLVVTFVIGALLGAGAGVAVLYYNPLTEPRAQQPQDDDWTLTYRFPSADTVAFTHGLHDRVPVRPDGIQELWESTIRGAALTVLALRDENGSPAVLASRLSAGSARTDLLLEGALLSDHWLLTVPGRGSLFVRADSNVWPFVKDSLVPVWYLGRPWHGPTEYSPTVGPGTGDKAVVIGATGRFERASGSALERYRLNGFGPAGAEDLVGELYLHVVEPTTAVAAE